MHAFTTTVIFAICSFAAKAHLLACAIPRARVHASPFVCAGTASAEKAARQLSGTSPASTRL